MALGNYGGYGYPYPQAQSSITWVEGPQEVDAYPMVPNAAAALWDKHQTVIYIKQTDAMGRASVKILDYKERVSEAQAPAVTRDDIAEIKDRLTALEGLMRTKEVQEHE